MDINILGIESSCDDTSAAVIRNGFVLSNRIANQEIHKEYGGVVPELASRAHQQNIVPVVDRAIKQAEIKLSEISAVAYTRGPGLMGALLVGTSFAKGFALSRGIPMIDVNHLHAHILSLFLQTENEKKELPPFPFICLLVSGGHSQIMLVKDHLHTEIVGKTIDDAAGEAFDKCAKVMDIPYPGGPLVDKMAKDGNASAFTFSKPRIPGLNYSFSGLKTSFLYYLRDALKQDPDFIGKNKNDLCASVQRTIIEILMEKLILASEKMKVNNIAIAGGVSANSGLRDALRTEGRKRGWKTYIPEIRYSTDNAAMIGITGYYKYLNKDYANIGDVPFARIKI